MFKWLCSAAVTFAILALLGGATDAHAASGWTAKSNPDSSKGGELVSVSASSATNAWAVGYDSNLRGVIERWNGTTWSKVTSPTTARLWSVATTSPSNVWIAGNFADTLEHWTGKRWATVPLAQTSCGEVIVTSLAVVSATDIWAAANEPACGTTVEHWNGTAWSVTELDDGGETGADVWGAAATAHNVFVLSEECGGQGQCAADDYRYTGTTWLPSSPTQAVYAIPVAAATLSSKEAWEVGSYSAEDASGYQTGPLFPLAAHWNGTSWKVINPPGYSTSHSLSGVAEVSASNVWAVGNRLTSTNASRTLIDHWTGSAWVDVGGPNVGTGSNELNAVARIPGTSHLWAVGGATGGALVTYH